MLHRNFFTNTVKISCIPLEKEYDMKYEVEFFRHGRYLGTKILTRPGIVEFTFPLEDYFGRTYGVAVKILNNDFAHVDFWSGRIHCRKIIELVDRHGIASWVSEYKFDLQVVIRPIETEDK